MPNIYITRHGETEWNLQNKMQGWRESQLTELGRMQAHLLGERLADIEFEQVFSSPLIRALDTAKIVSNYIQTEIKIEEDLKEMSFGSWEGKTSPEIEKYDWDNYHKFWYQPHLYEANKGETFTQVKNRAVTLLKEIISRYNSNVLLVTHTVIIKTLMSYFADRSLQKLWDPPYIHQTCLNLVKVEEGEAEIVLHGDISHYKNN